MGYQTQRERIKEFIINKVLPAMKIKDLDYYKVMDLIIKEVGVSNNMAEDVLKGFMPIQIKELRILTIPDDKVEDYLTEIINKEKIQKKDDNEAEKVLKDLEVGLKTNGK